MKVNKKRIVLFLTTIISTGVVVFLIDISLNAYKNYQVKEIEAQKIIKEQWTALEKLQEEGIAVSKELKENKNQLIEIFQKNKKLERQIDEANNRVLTNNNSLIIKKWSPRIVKVTCSFYYDDGTVSAVLSGSGIVALNIQGEIAILTNKHVTQNLGTYTPRFCNITFTENNLTITSYSQSLVYKPGYDVSYLFIDNPSSYVVSKAIYSKDFLCEKGVSIGDEIIILGYPGIGSKTGITATEGIISGFDGDYYITSAKVEHGNSGGAAIVVKDNCYLGIPTMAIAGEIESLARILKYQRTFDDM